MSAIFVFSRVNWPVHELPDNQAGLFLARQPSKHHDVLADLDV